MSRTQPFPNALGWRVSGVVRGGLAHYFCGYGNHPSYLTICGRCSFHDSARLFPERMGRRRCKTCDRSAAKRGMQ